MIRIITGYSKAPANEVALSLKGIIKNKGYNVDIIDPFAEERSSSVFNFTLITKSTTKDLIKATEKQLPAESIDMLIGYSYGGAMAILQNKCRTNKIVLLSPALAGNTTIWSHMLKKLPLPAFRDMGSEKLFDCLFQRLKVEKYAGVQIVFFLPCDKMENVGDEKLVYDSETRKAMKELGQVHYIPVRKHRDMISNPKIAARIVERLKI